MIFQPFSLNIYIPFRPIKKRSPQLLWRRNLRVKPWGSNGGSYQQNKRFGILMGYCLMGVYITVFFYYWLLVFGLGKFWSVSLNNRFYSYPLLTIPVSQSFSPIFFKIPPFSVNSTYQQCLQAQSDAPPPCRISPLKIQLPSSLAPNFFTPILL